MSKMSQQSDADQVSEGGMFYPTGHIVTAHKSHQDANGAAEALRAAGFDGASVTVVGAADMLAQADRNLENPGLLAAIGGSIASRQQQHQLAKDGHSFLIIDASTDELEARALAALARGSVSYATKYRRLVIENLMPKIPSAVAEPSPTPPR